MPSSTHLIGVQADSTEAWDRLLQAYEFEFSAITGKRPDQHGRMALDTELSDHTFGWILYDALTPMGLAAIHDHGSHREVAEFYIIPSCRQAGRGRDLAASVFQLFPGAWEVKQLAKAHAAQAFWRRTLASLPCQELREDLFEDPYWGSVVRQRFSWTTDSDKTSLGRIRS